MADFIPQPDVLVNSTTAGDQIIPFTAPLAGGGWVVVWTSMPDQRTGEIDTQQVWAQVYNASGERVGGETLVFADTSHGHVAAGVTGLADGSFVVAATSIYSSGSATVYNALTQHLGASAQPIGGEVVVKSSQNPNDAVSSNGVFATSDGGYFVGVRDIALSSGTSSSFLQHFDASGAATAGAIAAMPDSLSAAGYEQTAVLSNGDVVVAAETVDNGAMKLNWEQLTPSGTVVSTLSFNTAGSASGHPAAYPVVAALAGGNSVLLWNDVASSSWKLQFIDSGGHAIGSPLSLAAHSYGMPDVDALAGGGFLVSYLQQSGGTTVQLLGQQYDAAGNAVGGEMQLSPAMDNNNFQSPIDEWDVAATPDGGFFVTYNLAASGEDVIGQKWNVAGAGSSYIQGTTGNDRLTGTAGNDTFDGGAGIDTAVIGAPVAGAWGRALGYSGISLSSQLGTDTLLGIERVQFSDALFALDTHVGQHTWEAAGLYHLGFGALPGVADLSRWTAQADQSANMGELAQRMIDAYAPGISSHDLVAYLYQQLTHQAPSEEVVQSYVNQIGPGNPFATQGALLAYAASLSLNTDGVASIVGTAQPLDPSYF